MIFFQPEYVKNFKCDGKRCDAQCCKRWIIDIDKDTFDSYTKIESSAKEITSHIYYHEDRKGYSTKLRADNSCPFLREDNLCMIQKNYGEKFLSMACQTFPRHILKVGDLYERSLDLTCPLVAGMALLPRHPMNFELIEEKFQPDSKVAVQVMSDIYGNDLPPVSEIQMIAIFILQRRNLTLDQRLAALGIYLENIEKFILEGKMEKISDLTEFFTLQNFFTEKLPALLSDINFQSKDFIRTIFIDVLENLYDDTSPYKPFEKIIFDALEKTLGLNFNESPKILIDVDAATKKFISLSDEYKNFVQIFSTIFENYLVHEFFFNMYPWRIAKSIRHNYGVFVASYKIVELILFILSKTYPNGIVNDILKTIILLSITLNHTPLYLKNLSTAIEKVGDTVKIISTFLQTKGRLD